MVEFFKNNNEIGNSKKDNAFGELYSLFNVKNPDDLYDLYFEEDQKLMNSYSWDYENNDLIVNRIKNIIETTEENKLTKKEKDTKELILWFWYHHATSCALFQKKDKEKAKLYSTKALEHVNNDNPNKITKLLYFLANDDLTEASKWADDIENSTEKQTALNLIKEYKSLNLV